LGNVLHGRSSIDAEQQGERGNRGDGCKVAQGIVGQLAIDRRIYGHRTGCSEQQRVAVRQGPSHVFCGDECSRARLVFNYHGLTHALSQFLTYEACQEVIATTRSKANDNPNGSCWIVWIGLSQHRQASSAERSDPRKTHHNAAPRRLRLAWHASSRGV